MAGIKPHGGVGFGADEVVAALFDNEAQGVGFVVKGVEGEQFVVEFDFVTGKQGARFADFAVFFFPGGRAHGDGASGFLLAKGDDYAGFAVADGFAVEGEALGQDALVVLQPPGEGGGEGDGVNVVDEVVEGVVAGHFEPTTAVFFAPGQSDGFAVTLAQGGDFLVDVGHVLAAHDHAEGNEGEHGAQGMAATVGAAGVGHFQKGLAEAFEVGDFQRGAFSAGAGVGLRACFGKFRGAHQRVSPGMEGVEPEFFGASVGLVVVGGGVAGAGLGVAFGVAGELPVGDFVNGAGVAFGVAEAFGQERLVAVGGMPLGGDGPQGKAEGLGGQIGAAGLVKDEEAAQLDDEFEAAGTGDGVPANGFITAFEVPGGGAPDEDGDDLSVFEDKLAKAITGFAARPEIVLLVEELVGQPPVGGGFGEFDFELGSGLVVIGDPGTNQCGSFHSPRHNIFVLFCLGFSFPRNYQRSKTAGQTPWRCSRKKRDDHAGSIALAIRSWHRFPGSQIPLCH